MELPTEYKHGVFLERLENALRVFENTGCIDPLALQPIVELKEKISLLEHIYTDYNATVQQLRALVHRYQQVQKSTRIQLRMVQIKFSKKTDLSSNQSYNPIL